MAEKIMAEIFKGQMLSYYDDMIQHNGGIDAVRDSIPVLKLGVVTEMLQVYVKSLLAAVHSATTEGEQINAVFVIEMVNDVSQGMNSMNNETVEGITEGLISLLTNVNTPAYDLSRVANVRSPMVDDAKEVFVMMANFLKD